MGLINHHLPKIESKPLNATVWFTISNFIVKGISFISLPVFTNLLGPEEYGILSLYLTYEQIILVLGTFEMFIGTYQRGIFKFGNKKEEYSKATVLLMNIITTGLFICLLFFHGIVYKRTRITLLLLFLLFFRTILQPSYECWIVRKRIDYKYIPVVFTSIIFAVLNTLIPIAAIFLINRTAEIKLSATLISTCFFGLFFWISTVTNDRQDRHYAIKKEYLEFNIRMSLPNIPHALSFLVLSQADRIMIGSMQGDREVAYYSVAYTVAGVITIIQSSVLSVLSPWMYKKLDKKDVDSIGNVSLIVAVILGCIVILFITVIPELFKLIFSNEYYSAMICIPSIAMSGYFMLIYALFSHYEIYYEKPQYLMYVSVVCAIINIALNYIYIPVFGYVACCWTTLVSYILFAIGHGYFSYKVSKRQKVSFPFRLKELISLSLCFAIATVVISRFYYETIFRYLVLILVLCFLIFKRDAISKMIREIK